MVAIVECESDFTHYKKDGTVLVGRVDADDIGVAQINRRYHPGVDSKDLWENLSYARELYDEQGSAPWVCRNMVASR